MFFIVELLATLIKLRKELQHKSNEIASFRLIFFEAVIANLLRLAYGMLNFPFCILMCYYSKYINHFGACFVYLKSIILLNSNTFVRLTKISNIKAKGAIKQTSIPNHNCTVVPTPWLTIVHKNLECLKVQI